MVLANTKVKAGQGKASEEKGRVWVKSPYQNEFVFDAQAFNRITAGISITAERNRISEPVKEPNLTTNIKQLANTNRQEAAIIEAM